MKLLAISDLHVGFRVNREAVERLPPSPDDWLILAGDVGESPAHLEFALRTLVPRFRQIVWVPGNHELWTPRVDPHAPRGVARYEQLVALCRTYGVLTPEDPYPVWPGDSSMTALTPVFLLYDYSFCPDDVPPERAVAWAVARGLRCADEHLLDPHPFPSRAAWCAARVAETERRLAAIPAGRRIVLINHFPLRRDLARLPAIPPFAIWCGTRLTEDWHVRFPVRAVVSGHLHIRGTHWRDRVRFEEVSLGYPDQWERQRGAQAYLRQILPDPTQAFQSAIRNPQSAMVTPLT